MNLKITSYNNFCKVKGDLTKGTVKLFLKELYTIVSHSSTLTLSLEGIEEIDRHGIRALAQLHNEFIRQNKQLSVIGLGSDEVYNHFKTRKIAAA